MTFFLIFLHAQILHYLEPTATINKILGYQQAAYASYLYPFHFFLFSAIEYINKLLQSASHKYTEKTHIIRLNAQILRIHS